MAEIAAAPRPTNAAQRTATPRILEKRMFQRSMVAGFGLVVVLSGCLITLHSRKNGTVHAMGDLREALASVNTWKIEGWKLAGGHKMKWEVWGRRRPFFYHEIFGNHEILDDGTTRTIAVPPAAGVNGVMLKMASDPNLQSNLGLSMLLGLDRIKSRNGRLVSSGASGETYMSEISAGIGLKVTKQQAFFTFPEGSPLPSRYERVDRVFPKPDGVIDTDKLEDDQAESVSTLAHLDVKYEVPINTEAMQMPARPGYKLVDTARAPRLPSRTNVASGGGLTLYAANSWMDSQGDVVLRYEGYIGDARCSSDLPANFFTTTNLFVGQNSLGEPVFDNSTRYREFECTDDLGRHYIPVPVYRFNNDGGESWLVLAPLTSLKPGAPLPRRLMFPLRMSVNTWDDIPDASWESSQTVADTVFDLTVDLPARAAPIDVLRLSAQYCKRVGFDPSFPTTIDQSVLLARADAWRDLAYKTMDSAHHRTRVSNGLPGPLVWDEAKAIEAREELKTAEYWTALASHAYPHNRAMLESNLQSIKGIMAKMAAEH
jgi:hypothetical protein